MLMYWPWKGMAYSYGPTGLAPDAYWVPPSAIDEGGVSGGLGQVVVTRGTVGTYLDRILANQNILAGLGQTDDTPGEGAGSTTGRWVAGISLGVSLGLLVGTLLLKPGKGG